MYESFSRLFKCLYLVSYQIMGMKQYGVLMVFLLLAAVARGTHIVGGEFELVHTGVDASGRFTYNFGLILYFDLKNGALEIIQGRNAERLLRVRIFRKRDHAVMGTYLLRYRLPQSGELYETVEYYQPECADDNSMETARLYFQHATFVGDPSDPFEVADEDFYNYSPLVLSPADFDDPGGYYVAWERCCRNYTITNIYSQNPDEGTLYAGQTFYLEFPPLMKNGQPFINSSPALFPPLTDYACPYRLYYVDFKGTDADGDSLVYSLTEPLNTHAALAVPAGNVPGRGPYPTVVWQPPFSINNIMQGEPDLTISAEGLLTVTPTVAGLFAFAVKCEEYRAGEKIGEIRRDFQMLVLTDCPVADSPIVEAKPIGGAFQRGQLNVEFSNTTDDDSRCVIIQVKDPSSMRIENSNQDEVKIRAIPLGFKNSTVRDILPEISSATLIDGDSAEFKVCFPKCPYILGSYQIGIIAEDNSCPLPLLDTIVVTVNVQLPDNKEPYFAEDQIIETVREGSGIVSWQIIGRDDDMDPLELLPLAPIGYSLTDYGFGYEQTVNRDGRVEATLTWDTRCDVIDFSNRTNFPFSLALNDIDECDLLPPVLMDFNLTMDLYDLTIPVIEYVPDPALEAVDLTTKIYDPVNFQVRGSDAGNKLLLLRGTGLTLPMAELKATFPEASGDGEVLSLFSWQPHCENVALGRYAFEFIVSNDENRCNYYLADTLLVELQVEKPDNSPPLLTANGVEDELSVNYVLGDPIAIPLLGVDSDVNPKDLLTLELDLPAGENLPDGFTFQPQQGYGSVQGMLAWAPDCDIFLTPDYKSSFEFVFKVTDDRCFSDDDADQVKVKMTIQDKAKNEVEFVPPNFVSPNGDPWNEYFAMVKRNDQGELVSILPTDNCSGVFISMNIFNRWGGVVFESTDRNFKWFANDVASGVYFYTLVYSNKTYKGTISVSADQ